MIAFFIITLVLLLGIAFGIGNIIAEMSEQKTLFDVFVMVEQDPSEKKHIREQEKHLRSDMRSNLISLIFSFIVTAGVFALTFWGYRDYTLTQFVKGDIKCETVVRSTHRANEEVKIDTVYNFYRVKEKE